VALVLREPLPGWRSAMWAGLSGFFGILGLAALYRGLAAGHMATSAPTSGVVGAVLPVAFGIATEGCPTALQLAGFAIAVAGIWFVSRAPSTGTENLGRALGLGIAAGIGFGLFFILIAQVEPGLLMTPVIVVRCVSLTLISTTLLVKRLPLTMARVHPSAAVAGVLDAAGNVLYMLATQLVRLDVSTMLASLYPAVTVLLARFVLKEHVYPTQWAGLLLCMLAVVLIAV
ncbi:MAG: DMT family transporter, partial [Anaerolineales bacterium]|nr:DMT family transporter [Anaerolineales bacterium]